MGRGVGSRSPMLFATLLTSLPPPMLIHRRAIVHLSAVPPRRRASSKVTIPGAAELVSEDTVFTGDVTPRLLSEKQKKVVAYRQKYKCAACDCLLPPAYQVDHIKPLALGGTNGLTNLQALCTQCHTSKTRQQRRAILDAGKLRAELASAAPFDAFDSNEYDLEADEAAAAAEAELADALTPPPQQPQSFGLNALELSSLRLLRGMNQQQLAAVVCTDGPMRVAAGPGTGKTRVLTARIAHLVVEAGVPARRVLAVTFTNKAARELRERITALIGPAAADGVTMGTFHSLCLAMLRVDIEKLPDGMGYRRGFTVYDEYASLKLIKKVRATGSHRFAIASPSRVSRRPCSACARLSPLIVPRCPSPPSSSVLLSAPSTIRRARASLRAALPLPASLASPPPAAPPLSDRCSSRGRSRAAHQT